MAESNHDDVADALARLAGGDVAPSEREHEPPPALTPPPATPKPPAKPAFRTAPPAPRPPGLRPPPSAPARPVAPPTPVAPVEAPSPPRPARPQRPAAPTIRPMAPPNLTPPEPPPPAFTADAGDASVIDDDDSVIVPAPDASVFIPKKKPVTSAEAQAKVARRKRIEFRRTVIPILLTVGVLLVGFGLLPIAMGSDSIIAALPSWVSPTLIASGAVLLVLAAANMASVRSMLSADAAAA